MSRLSNLGLILMSPTTVARNVIEDPHWVIPLVVVLAVSFLAAVTTFEYQVAFQREHVGEIIKERNPDADLDSMFESTPTKQMMSGVLAAVLGGVIILIFAGVLKGAASVAGGSVSFRRMFAFSAYASVIGALGSLIKIPLVLMKESIDVRTGLAAFAPSLSVREPMFVFLSSFDIFSVWQLVAFCFGFGVLAGFSVKKSTAIVVGLWAGLILIRIGLSLLSRLGGVS
jgi:hypothetical protein